MKKIISFMMVTILIVTAIPVACFAVEEKNAELVEEVEFVQEDSQDVQEEVNVLGNSEDIQEDLGFGKTETDEPEYVEGEAIVVRRNAKTTLNNSINNNSTIASVDSFESDIEIENLMTVHENANPNMEPALGGYQEEQEIQIVKSSSLTTDELIKKLEQRDDVISAEPNYIYHISSTSTPDFTKDQYNVSYGPEKGMHVPNWNDSSNKNADCVVAVLDSGVDYTHEDLKDGMWDEGEKYETLKKLGGGKYGLNADALDTQVGDSKDPMDDNGHGTHCSGIIAAQWNDRGVSGVTNGTKIMALKATDSVGKLTTRHYISCFNYVSEAIKAGVPIKVVSNSWSGVHGGSEITNQGAVLIFAAGNESKNLDAIPYTSNFIHSHNPSVIIVNATDKKGDYAFFSNYGANETDIAAPGVNIISTVPGINTVPDARFSDPILENDFEGGSNIFCNWTSNTENTSVQTISENGYESDHCLKIKYDGEKSAEIISEEVDLSDAKPKYITFMMKITETGSLASTMAVGMRIPTKSEDGPEMKATTFRTIDEWAVLSINLPEDTDYEKFKLEFSIMSLCENPLISYPFTGYIDNIVFTNETFPYDYMSGTSQACPAVAGEAAILFANYPNEKNDKIAARIIGSVERKEEHKNKCISGGIANLEYALDKSGENTAPVVYSATRNDSKITVAGYFFGNDSGELKVNDKTLTIEKWSDEEIVAKLPDGFTSSDVLVEVKRNTGNETLRTGHRRISIYNEANRFKMLKISDFKELDNTMPISMEDLHGKLYLCSMDSNDRDLLIFEYNPDTNKWKKVYHNQEYMVYCQTIGKYNGKIVIPVLNKKTGSSELITYEPYTGKIEMVKFSSDVGNFSLLNDDGELLLVGGTIGEEKSNKIQKVNMKTGELTEVGEIQVPKQVGSIIRNSNGEIYYAYGTSLDVQKIEKDQNGHYVGKVIKEDGLPEGIFTEGDSMDWRAVGSFTDGFILTGFRKISEEGKILADTFVGTTKGNEFEIKPIDVLFSTSAISKVCGTIVGDRFYVLASTAESKDGFMFGYLDGYKEVFDEESMPFETIETENLSIKYQSVVTYSGRKFKFSDLNITVQKKDGSKDYAVKSAKFTKKYDAGEAKFIIKKVKAEKAERKAVQEELNKVEIPFTIIKATLSSDNIKFKLSKDGKVKTVWYLSPNGKKVKKCKIPKDDYEVVEDTIVIKETSKNFSGNVKFK